MLTIPGKIPLHIHPAFWLIAIMIAGLQSNFNIEGMIIWTLVILVSVTVHEFGHALTALIFGQRAHIDLVAFGGLTHRHGPKLSLWKEFLIVLNGPLAGLMLAMLCLYLSKLQLFESTYLSTALTIGTYANIFWTFINLIPIQPLDGGHLLRIMLEAAFGLRGVKIALFISMIVAFLSSLGFFMLGNLLFGALVMMFAFENWRAWQGSLQVVDQDKNTDLQLLLRSAEKDYQKGSLESALQKLTHLLNRTHSGLLFQNASQLKAKILNSHDRFDEAYEVLLPLKQNLPPESQALLQKLAYRRGNWEEAITIGTDAYQRKASYETALINAFCYGNLADAKRAVGWLQCAIHEGLPKIPEVLHNKEFDSIRSDPLFQRLQESV